MAPNKNTFSGSDIRWKALPPLPDERQTQSSHKSKKDTRDRSRSSFIQREEGSSTKAKETKYRCSQHSSSTSSKPNSATFHSVPQSVSQPISIGRSSTHLYLPSPLRPGHRSHSSWEPPRSATPDRSPVSPTMTRSVSKPNLSTSYQSPVSPYYDTASQDARSRASQTHSRQSNSSWAAYRPVGSGSPDGSAFSDPSQYHLFVEATSGLSPVAQTHAQAPSSLRSPSSSGTQTPQTVYRPYRPATQAHPQQPQSTNAQLAATLQDWSTGGDDDEELPDYAQSQAEENKKRRMIAMRRAAELEQRWAVARRGN